MSATSPTVADHLARVDADGYTILERVIEPDLVAAVRDAIRRIEVDLDVQPKGTQAEGIATKRMYNLLAKDPVFAALPVHPAVLPIAEGMLDRGLLISGLTAMDIGPGERAQPLHGDDAVMSRHLPRPHPPLVVTTLWAFTDFTSENGATRFVRGSHRFAETPDRPGALDGHEIECFEAPAGSVMVLHGSLWHGGGANATYALQLGRLGTLASLGVYGFDQEGFDTQWSAQALLGACDLVAVHDAESMDEAVSTAVRLVRPPGVVLLAPACSSFDMFADYADRGRRFKDAVRTVLAKAKR